MVNREANIDLLFRNGLRDYEVLPPVEAWNNIFPVIRKKQRPVLFLRAAAVVAVLLSIGFITYRLSREISIPNQIPFLALGEESSLVPDNSTSTVRSGKTSGNNSQVRKVPGEKAQFKEGVSELSDAGITKSSDPEVMTEIRNISVGDFFIAPQSLQTIHDINISVENLNQGYQVIDKPDYEISKEKINRWSVTAMASPTYYLRSGLGSSEISNQISSSEQSRISYSGGVAFAYKISRKLSIQSGLYYSSIGNLVDGINSFAGFRKYDYTKGDHNFEVLTSSGRIYTENSDVFLIDNSGNRVLTRYNNDIFDPNKANLSYINSSLFQNFSYLEMPVIVRYKFVDRSVDVNLIGGLSYNLLVNNSVHTVIGGDKYNIGKTAGLNSFMVSSSLGMGMEYNLSEKFSLNLEPTFRYYLNPFGTIPGLKTHPYSFGVFSGLSYKF